MIIGITKETAAYETRVAATPQSIKQLKSIGYTVLVEDSAGIKSCFNNQSYISSGAEIISSAPEIFSKADILLKINPPTIQETQLLKNNAVVVTDFQNINAKKFFSQTTKNKITYIALNKLPRLSKYQAFDIMSSQNNLSGYQAVICAASLSPHIIPMMITAAGTIPPLKFLIIGAGIAGLQSIATAKRLGAKVFAFDPKPEAENEIESLGAIFIKDYFSKLSEFDIIITSAFSLGKRAPLIIGEKEINKLKFGTVLIDMACANGGNIIDSQNRKTIKRNNCIIHGNSNFATSIPQTASTLFANNLANFITHYTISTSHPTFNIHHPELKDILFQKG